MGLACVCSACNLNVSWMVCMEAIAQFSFEQTAPAGHYSPFLARRWGWLENKLDLFVFNLLLFEYCVYSFVWNLTITVWVFISYAYPSRAGFFQWFILASIRSEISCLCFLPVCIFIVCCQASAGWVRGRSTFTLTCSSICFLRFLVITAVTLVCVCLGIALRVIGICV